MNRTCSQFIQKEPFVLPSPFSLLINCSRNGGGGGGGNEYCTTEKTLASEQDSTRGVQIRVGAVYIPVCMEVRVP